MSAWKAGKVQWFDDESGKGMILDLKDGRMFFVNYQAINTTKKWKSLKEDQDVKFKLIETFCDAYIADVKEVK
jgi:cold shock CspA family protein